MDSDEMRITPYTPPGQRASGIVHARAPKKGASPRGSFGVYSVSDSQCLHPKECAKLMARRPFTFVEFFAGGGMARAGLGKDFRCLLANDINAAKAKSYAENYGNDGELIVGDVGRLSPSQFPSSADLAWASFPCQDLSLAGNGAGLSGGRSGTFWPFWKLVSDAASAGRAPSIIALENVHGTLTARGGKDFASIIKALSDAGYRVGAMVIDAAHFVPQSRPRLFIVGHLLSQITPASLSTSAPSTAWHTQSVINAYNRLPSILKESWVWWNVGMPSVQVPSLASLVEEQPSGVAWSPEDVTQRLLDMMSSTNLAKVDIAKKLGRLVVGTVYRRTRLGPNDEKIQRAEVRFDGVAGCLRTPGGGSSRQTLLFVHGGFVRSRLLSPREAARLMGLPDSYKLPANYNEAYHLAGDGVVVPVVRHLAQHLFLPLLRKSLRQAA